MKYKLTDETILYNNTKLYRIEALKDFSDIKTGDKGGFVESENNLSHEGYCWIYDNAKVYDNAIIQDNALIYDNTEVYDTAMICGDSNIHDNVKIYGDSFIGDQVEVFGNVEIHGNASLHDNVHVSGFTDICGDVEAYGNVKLNFNKHFIIKGDVIIYNESNDDNVICDKISYNNEH